MNGKMAVKTERQRRNNGTPNRISPARFFFAYD